MAFESLTDKLQNVFKKLKSKGRLTEEDVKIALKEVKMALLEADVNFKVVKQFIKSVEERAIGSDVMNGLNPGQMVIKIVNEEMIALMGSETTELQFQPGKAITTIMMCGLQGAGKTTAAAKIAGKLKKYLDEDRLWHTLGVMQMSASLAIRYDYPMERAQLAGLLHDCAKCIPAKKKLKICKDNKIPVTDFEREHTFLLHAKVGAWVAREKYGVTDPEILSAITWHTTGKENMTLLEKIVYIADYIEPARNKAPRLAEIRKIAFENLDLCMYEILHDTLEYLDDDPQDIDQATIQAYNYYSDLINTK